MDEKTVEKIFAVGYQVGIINLARELGLIDEHVTEQQAYKMYGKRRVQQWRHKRWIVGYPSGNSQRAKFYYRRSELETASRMLDMVNIIPSTRINQIIQQDLTEFKNKKISKPKIHGTITHSK
jgi:protoporphyrinogen oxidase